MNLLEILGGLGILTLAAATVFGAAISSSHVSIAPAMRDQVLLAARNAAVEARAAAAYDAGAASAILAAPSASWSSNGVQLRSSALGGTLSLVAIGGTEKASIAYPVAREGLPQGAIIDTSGNLLTH